MATDRFTLRAVPRPRVKPEDVLESIEKVARSQGLPIIGPIRGLLLDEVILKHRPATVLEVGTLVGYSAIRMGRHLKDSQTITCVELRRDMAETARSNITKAGLSDRIQVIVGDAKEVLPSLKGSVDMVFFDAVKEDYIVYLRSVERLLHGGSVVVADNVKSYAQEVKPYLDYVRNSGKYTSEYREAPPNFTPGAADALEISVRL